MNASAAVPAGQTTPLPLVSCIMPTADRRAFVAEAIATFLRQDYPHKELVILDDGADAVADLVPADPHVRYERLAERLPLGTKRNHCIEASRGDLILHWDDDDWMASWRIRYQVTQLLAEQAEVCGLSRLFFYDAAARQGWEYVYPASGRPWVAGGTLGYTRALWWQHPFSAVNVGEDTRFVWNVGRSRLLRLDDNRFYVAQIHAQNTSPKRTRDRRWHAVPYAQVEALMMSQPHPQPVEMSNGQVAALGADRPRPLVAPAAREEIAAHDHVTVSLAYWRAEATLRRSVESILGQSHRALTLVVVNDGDRPPWRLLDDIDDPRLVRCDLTQNWGRYFADAVVLAACHSPYFCIQDADDWSEPQRLARLLQQLRLEHAVAAVSDHAVHRSTLPGAAPQIERYREINRPLTTRFEHRAHHHALFRSDALRTLGGYYGGFRIGYDTLLINLLLMTGRIACVAEPLYHRQLRPDSLSASSTSGFRSATRRAVTGQLRELYAAARRAHSRYLELAMSMEELGAELRQITARHVTETAAQALRADAARLRKRLAALRAAAPVAQPSLTAPRAQSSLLDDARLPWDDWSLSRADASALLAYLERRRPTRLLEAGSGVSTVLLAALAAQTGAAFVSLEHAPGYAEQTRSLLQQFGLAEHVDLRCAPIQPVATPAGAFPWYTAPLDGQFDFVLLDGPPQRHGRQAALFALAPHLADGWEIWLHDGSRAHERACLELWQGHFPITYAQTNCAGKSFLRLQSKDAAHPSPARPRVGVSILTGGRLHLLRRTVNALMEHAPQVLVDHHVVVLVNGPDPATLAYVEALPFVDRCLAYPEAVLPIGAATSRLMAALLEEDPAFCLHLEDDWVALDDTAGWLAKAQALLQRDPTVGQVRLRHSQDKVLSYHMVTRQPLRWEARGDHVFAASAHFTFNPSLIRGVDVPRIFPCRDEREAQVRFLQTGLATAQLLPGVFVHSGGEESRRLAQHRVAQLAG